MKKQGVECPDCQGSGKQICGLCAGHGIVAGSLRDLRLQVIKLRFLETQVFPDLFAFAKAYVAVFTDSTDSEPPHKIEHRQLLSQAKAAIQKAGKAVELNETIQASHREPT